MGWRMKAILGLLIVLEAVNCAQLSLKDARIDDLEGQQIINRCRLENWQTRAMTMRATAKSTRISRMESASMPSTTSTAFTTSCWKAMTFYDP